ncbi:hypothetical protein [Polymorphospora rubra]|uniref:Uncharacterized protein n=1 Tax=Polymorphospora rubra TaxID=338584 RepID=A0A810N821_9ACTN|nr:hypothetical protein [Polymorphospora rubra]BCJ67773.1 hypothetical protein Prubr_47940 [Polymorphospora rubra]
MTDETWRDEQRLPLKELSEAMASWDTDGQLDDVTGNDAGAEAAFGHDAAAEELESTPADRERLTDEQRAHRPSTTGRTGPH